MKMTKKRLLIVIGTVLVVIGGIIAFGVWLQQNTLTSEKAKTTKEVKQYPVEEQQGLVDEINQKYGEGDYAGAIKLIEGQQNVDDPATQLLLASAYANNGEYQKALDVYKKLDEAGKLPDVELQNMAAVAESAKDYPLAIDLYKRAKEYALSSKDENQEQAAILDYKIAELEKKQ